MLRAGGQQASSFCMVIGLRGKGSRKPGGELSVRRCRGPVGGLGPLRVRTGPRLGVPRELVQTTPHLPPLLPSPPWRHASVQSGQQG